MPPVLLFSSSLLLEKSLPGAVVDRVLESRARLHQAPTERPLIGVIEALARVGLGRSVEDARDPEVFGLEQPAGFLDQVARVLAWITVDRLGGARLGAEHRGQSRPVELAPCRLAAGRMRLHEDAHAALLGDADP